MSTTVFPHPYVETTEERALEAEMDAALIATHRARGHRGESIDHELRDVHAFRTFVGAPLWRWSAECMTAYAGAIGARYPLGTVLGKEGAVRRYCAFGLDPAYDWDARAFALTGQHIRQICTRQNTHRHGRVPVDPKRPVSRAEVQRLFAKIREQYASYYAISERAALPTGMHYGALSFALAYGSRAHEEVNVELRDVSPATRRQAPCAIADVYLRYGKSHDGGPPQPRTVPSIYVFRRFVNGVAWYQRAIRPQLVRANSPRTLILSQRGQKLREASLSNIFEFYRDLAGLPRDLTLHSLRHTFGTVLYESGLDLPTIAKLMGHKHESTTIIYARLADPVMRQRVLEHNRRLIWESEQRCAARSA